jgi:ABC-type transporter Mla subunit MlaD
MKRSNREVNIFNMSLLDILCGALGAFCFMMLSLLPYYRPPGENFHVNEQQKKLLDEVQKIKDLAERLKNTSTAEDLTELVKQLREMIAKLENEIKQLQGQVNALYAENEDLKKRIAKLEQEKQQLDQLNRQLQQEKQQLVAKNEKLENEKRTLLNQLVQKMPWTITMTTADTSQFLDCSLHETVIKSNAGQPQPEFDPQVAVQPVFWGGDSLVTGNISGTVTRVVAERAVGSTGKLYASLYTPPDKRTRTTVSGRVQGSKLNTITIAPAPLTPERPWIFIGTLKTEAPDKITFTEATLAERDAEWERLTKAKPPKQEDGLTDAVMGPGFEQRKREYESMTSGNAPPPVRIALLSKWQAEAKSDRERKYVADLLAKENGRPESFPFPPNNKTSADAARRRAEYTRAVREAETQDQKVAILRKWMGEADTDQERNQVRAMLQQVNASAGPGSQPSTDRRRAIEEFQKQQQNQQPQPKPQ